MRDLIDNFLYNEYTIEKKIGNPIENWLTGWKDYYLYVVL
jgi:hypothetical protein